MIDCLHHRVIPNVSQSGKCHVVTKMINWIDSQFLQKKNQLGKYFLETFFDYSYSKLSKMISRKRDEVELSVFIHNEVEL